MGSRRTFHARDFADVYDDDDFLNEITGATRRPVRQRALKKRDRQELHKDRTTLRRDQPSKPFKCRRCKAFIGAPLTGGKHRNHCPNCLCSLHVDRKTPGDRASDCRSLMEPVGAAFHRNGEQVVIHHCLGCGITRHNRVAADDSPLLLMTLPLTALEDQVAVHEPDTESEVVAKLGKPKKSPNPVVRALLWNKRPNYFVPDGSQALKYARMTIDLLAPERERSTLKLLLR